MFCPFLRGLIRMSVNAPSAPLRYHPSFEQPEQDGAETNPALTMRKTLQRQRQR
jgi:hypothetical protein